MTWYMLSCVGIWYIGPILTNVMEVQIHPKSLKEKYQRIETHFFLILVIIKYKVRSDTT